MEIIPFIHFYPPGFFRNRLIGWIGHALLEQPSISIHRKKFNKSFFLISYELKTPSVEMACLLGVHNKMQAACEGMHIFSKNP